MNQFAQTPVVRIGKLKGPFRGLSNYQPRFTFANGVTWRQNELKYLYFYAGNPRARVMYKNGAYFLDVDGSEEMVEVIKEA